VMKAIKYTIRALLIAVGIFYVFPVVLLQVPYFQKKITVAITSHLEEKMGTTVQVERINFQLFNRLVLRNVYMEDQSGEILLTAKGIAAKFDFIPLLKKKFHFSSVQIYTFNLHLNRENGQSPLNIQYIIDAFQNPNIENENSNIDLNIKDLSLGHGNFIYRQKDKPSTPGKFNPNDIQLNNISAKIVITDFSSKSLIAYIKRLSFMEKSGFQVNHLTFDLTANSNKAQISLLSLDLPRSDIRLSYLEAYYDKINPKDSTRQIFFNFQIDPSRLYLKDISSMVPVFSYFKDELEIHGKASGTFDNIDLSNLVIKEKNNMMIAANIKIKDLASSHPADIYIDGIINDSFITSKGIQKMSNNFSPDPVILPDPVKQLGEVSLNGTISGCINNLTAYVYFMTAVGNVTANINFGKEKTGFIKGTIASQQINMKKLLENDDFGLAGFEISMNTTLHNRTDIQGHVDALLNQFDYKSYNYENVSMLGDFTSDSFKGLLNMDSPDGQVSANGLFLFMQENSEFNFSAKVSNLLLNKLNLTQKYKGAQLSFSVGANIKGNHADNLLGKISFQNLQFITNKGSCSLDNFSVDVSENENKKCLFINSDVINGKISGFYSLKALPAALKQSVIAYLPSIFPAHDSPGEKKIPDNDILLDFTVKDTEQFSHVLELPFILFNQSKIIGEYNSLYDKFWMKAHFPRFKTGNLLVEGGFVDLNNQNNAIEMNLDGVIQQKKNKKLIISARMKAMNDSITTFLNWSNNEESKYRGYLDFTTQVTFLQENNSISARMQIQPSELIFNDSVWTVGPAKINYQNGQLNIDHLLAQHNKQSIAINGNISKDKSDEIFVSLDKVNLDYIFKSLNIEALTFGGVASGLVRAKDIYHTRKLSTMLDVTDFSFNNVVCGDLILRGRWNDEKQGVEMNGDIIKNDSSFIAINGIIYPQSERLSIVFDAHKANAAFLRKYLNSIVQNFSGEATGQILLYGNLNNPTIKGNAFIEKGSLDIEFLNTTYTFKGDVKCDSTEISTRNMKFYDKYGNEAVGSGSAHHKLLDNFTFSANIFYKNFLVFDATSQTNPFFYGTVFGTGTASLKGNESLVAIDVSLANTNKTIFTLDLMREADIVDYDFINFITKKEETSEQKTVSEPSIIPKEKSGTEINLSLMIEANNSAEVDMIMDPVSGDKISAKGHGTMNISYGTKLPLKVSGKYAIEQGKYNFSFQQAVFKNFEIQEGSSIDFSGDPLNDVKLDVVANYIVSANLEDLDQQILQTTGADGAEKSPRLSARTTMPVNCILKLSGALQQPVIKFDLGLPGATPELERQVKSYIHTEDMMNRQILCLLLMGRFYTAPEFTRSNSRSNNNLSYLTSTLSSQLSGMLGTLTDNFQIGTNFYQSGSGEENHMELDLRLSSSLFNNRLIINGNFGYVDNPYLSDNVPIIGDFDVGYKLTKSGEIRLKVFSRYNYRNYYSRTPELTQGVGVLLRRNFNSFNDLFRRKKENFVDLNPDSASSGMKFPLYDFSLFVNENIIQ
jgi:hypothetical protein